MSFELCEDRNLLAGASISGTVLVPPNQSGIVIDLYKDNGDLVFNPVTDGPPIQQPTDASGNYTFTNVGDGHYFIAEEPPPGFQNPNPPFHTVDVIGGAVYSAVTTNIDDFSDPNPFQQFTVFPSGTFGPMAYNGAGIIGGERDLTAMVPGPVNPITATGTIGTMSINNGIFDLASAGPGPGAEVQMKYDGNGPGLPADLTANGNTGIRLDFDFVQVGTGTTMDLQIDAAGPGGTAHFGGPITQDPTGFSFYIPFTSFSSTGTFSFADVTSLQFTYNQPNVTDVDFQLNQIVGVQQTNTGFNFTNTPITVSSIAGLKYVDSNNNANHDPGEPPIGGVIITLTGTDNQGHSVNLQTTTATDGTFKFSNLQPGTYTLTETPPDNFIIGKPKLGSAGGVIVSPLVMSSIVLPGSTDAVDYEFGELGLKPPYASKRSLLDPAQPVVLTAVYSNTPTSSTTNTATTAAKPVVVTTKAKVTTPAKKPAPKPAPKVPLVIPTKKKTK